MSILLIGLDEGLVKVVTRRLVAQGDEVRVLEPDERAGDSAREAGAHLASGAWDDIDLVARAATHVRTLVIGERAIGEEAVLDGALEAGVGRIVMCFRGSPGPALDRVRSADVDHVMLRTGSGRRFPRRLADPDVLAEAIDAADDLAGSPRLVLDLTDPQDRAALGIVS